MGLVMGCLKSKFLLGIYLNFKLGIKISKFLTQFPEKSYLQIFLKTLVRSKTEPLSTGKTGPFQLSRRWRFQGRVFGQYCIYWCVHAYEREAREIENAEGSARGE